MDVTNDGLPEVILSGDSSDGLGTDSIYIVGCKNSSYMVLKEVSSLEYPSPQLWTVQDLNGRPYVEMANEFWNAYQSTQKTYADCAAAMEYAAEHSDILSPLDEDYHGRQSHFYEPSDVCPFR